MPAFNKYLILKGTSFENAERIKLIVRFFRKKIFGLFGEEEDKIKNSSTLPQWQSQPHRIEHFKKLYRQYYGIKLSDKKAEMVFSSLVAMLRTLRRGMKKADLPLTGT